MSRRALIVEDEPTIARATERMVRRAHPDVELLVVNSAERAIAELGRVRFDFVISDYNLAGPATGGDVLAFVRESSPATAFLFVSSDDAIEALGVPYLTKPCAPSALRDAIAMMGAA